MRNVAILGGGIAGISAAYFLERERLTGAPVSWRLYEASSRLGGVLVTDDVEGFRIESGPDSFLTVKPWAADLARELGLGSELCTCLDARIRTRILVNGNLVPLPEGMMLMVPGEIWPVVCSPLFSVSTKLRMAWEYLFPPPPLEEGKDESIADFVKRHFGREVLDRVAAPLLAGVFGGDASSLSASAVLPQLLEMERKHGSLARAAISARKGRSGAPAAPLFTTFHGGMQQFAGAIIARLDPNAVELNSKVDEIHKYYDRWRVATSDGRLEMFDHVIIAMPAFAAASVLRQVDAHLSEELAAIKYADCMTVALAYDKSKLAANGESLPEGYGFLVPANEGKRMMALTIVGQKFPHRVPENGVLLRVFFTGCLELQDDDVLALACREVAEILGIRTAPLFSRIKRWRQTMPQYVVGHNDRIARIEQRLTGLPGIHLIGSAYRGVGVPDCIRGAKDTALGITVL